MKPEEYYRQMFEYYDGAKYDYNFESLRPPKDPCAEIEGTAHIILDHATSLLAGKDVLDIACGVGKWCRALAGVVKNITGVDWSPRLLDVAREHTTFENVSYVQDDVIRPKHLRAGYSGAFHYNFINHIPRVDWLEFLDSLHSRLSPGSPVVMGAQRHTAQRKAQLLKWSEELPDDLLSMPEKAGKRFLLIENEFDEVLIRLMLQNRGTDICVQILPPASEGRAGMWFASYRTVKNT